MGEAAIGIPMLIIDYREAEAERQLGSEADGEPFGLQTRGEQGEGRGHGKQVSRRAGEKYDQRTGEEETDPGQEKERIGLPAFAPGEEQRPGHKRGENEKPGMKKEGQPGQRIPEIEIRQVARKHLGWQGAGGKAREELPGSEGG